MANITCCGGHTFSDGEIPSPVEWTLVSDERVENVAQQIIDTVKAGVDVEARVQYLMMTAGPTTYRCPRCDRLLVFWKGITEPATCYRAEGE